MGILRKDERARGLRANTRYPVADALFSVTQRRVLGLLFGEPDRSFFATELIALAEGGSGAVQRELARLVAAGLVTVTRAGNRKHYQADPAAYVHGELRSLVRKTVVVPGAIVAALEPVRDAIELALVYGPATRPGADWDALDLLVVADALVSDAAQALLVPAEARLGCPVNLSLCTGAEFRLRAGRPNTFVARVLAGPKMVVIGRLPG